MPTTSWPWHPSLAAGAGFCRGAARSICLLAVAALILAFHPALAHAQAVRRMVGTERLHLVRPGDTLYTLAHNNGLALEHITFANRLPMQLEIETDTPVVIPGRHVLPAHPPHDGVVLNIPERGLYYFRHGRFQQFYPVVVGRVGFETPRGSFHVVMKTKDPTWVPPAWAHLGERIFPPGADNPLGDRWIGLSAPGVGIHGTNSPYALGMAVSHGCIRMYPDAARDLFEKAWIGMPVRIEYEPVKLGRDPSTGRIYIAAYPDVYHLADPWDEARRLRHDAGLEKVVSESALHRAVDPLRGRPVALVGSDVFVMVRDQVLSPRPGPVVTGEQVWIPPSVVQAVGLEVHAPPGGDQLEVKGNGHQLALRVVDAQPTRGGEPVARRMKGTTMLPATTLFKALGVPCYWSPLQQTLYIADED